MNEHFLNTTHGQRFGILLFQNLNRPLRICDLLHPGCFIKQECQLDDDAVVTSIFGDATMNKGEKEADSVALWVNLSEGLGCDDEFIAST